MSNIGKILLNFQVYDTGDPNVIVVADFSKWRVIEGLPAYMDITVPGFSEPITVPFKKNSTQGYTSLSLGISCHTDCDKNIQPLPDGIYEFCLRGGKEGQHTAHRYFLKKDETQEKLDKAWMRLDLKYDERVEPYVKQLNVIEGFLNAASAATRRGDIKRASDYFKLTNKKLKQYINCKNCI